MRISSTAVAGLMLICAGCAGLYTRPTPDEKRALAPTGKLRAAMLADSPTHAAAPDIGTELARRLGVPFEAVTYKGDKALVDSIKSDQSLEWGLPTDITFDFHSDGSPEGAEMLIKDFTESAFLKNGLKYLGPGQEAESNVSAIHEGFDQKIEAVVRVEVRYRSSSGRQIEETFRLDFSEFRGLSRLGKPHLYAMAQSLEKIQKDIGHIVSGFRKLRVDVFTEDDRARERDQREAARREHLAKNQGTPDDS